MPATHPQHHTPNSSCIIAVTRIILATSQCSLLVLWIIQVHCISFPPLHHHTFYFQCSGSSKHCRTLDHPSTSHWHFPPGWYSSNLKRSVCTCPSPLWTGFSHAWWMDMTVEAVIHSGNNSIRLGPTSDHTYLFTAYLACALCGPQVLRVLHLQPPDQLIAGQIRNPVPGIIIFGTTNFRRSSADCCSRRPYPVFWLLFRASSTKGIGDVAIAVNE